MADQVDMSKPTDLASDTSSSGSSSSSSSEEESDSADSSSDSAESSDGGSSKKRWEGTRVLGDPSFCFVFISRQLGQSGLGTLGYKVDVI